MRNIKNNPYVFLAVALAAVLTGVVGAYAFSFTNKGEVAGVTVEKVEGASIYDNSIVAVIGADDFASSGITVPRNSWPGEIISSEISHIQPQREGIITDWRVRIGDFVSAGAVLGKMSAPPATPELIAMLADKSESLARAKAQATIADAFAINEKERIASLKKSLDGGATSNSDVSFAALELMRKTQENKELALRSFIERAVSSHVLMTTNYTDWRYVTEFSGFNRQYGLSNPSVQNSYEMLLLKLVSELKNNPSPPIETAKNYFELAVRLASGAGSDESATAFKTAVTDDQKDFFEFLSEYREAQAALADKETEYKIMISEKNSMVEKDRNMAHAEAEAVGAAYDKVASEITSGTYIVAPRGGTVSAIYKKVGDLVGPEMPIAVISGSGKGLTVRMKIPNNIRKPVKGDIVSVVRPGFPTDLYKAKIVGVGTSLDDTGSYMADAIIMDLIDWPAGASVRVIAPDDSNVPFIRFSSVWWGENNSPNVWKISDGGRIFAQKIIIGRTIGSVVEVYGGLKDGDRIVVSPTVDVRENMLLDDLIKDVMPKTNSSPENGEKSGGHKTMEGM
jgi:multidrug efflux pump subunit AcrA (membrane-fusion protein)